MELIESPQKNEEVCEGIRTFTKRKSREAKKIKKVQERNERQPRRS